MYVDRHEYPWIVRGCSQSEYDLASFLIHLSNIMNMEWTIFRMYSEKYERIYRTLNSIDKDVIRIDKRLATWTILATSIYLIASVWTLILQSDIMINTCYGLL